MYPDRTPPRMKTLITPSHLMVATDLTDLDRLLPQVRAHAQGLGASVTFVHILPLFDVAISEETRRGTAAACESDALAILSAPVRELSNHGIACSVVVKRGIPGQTILEEAHRAGATRLLISCHRHGYTGQTMIGSVANALLAGSNVPVLVVPAGEMSSTHGMPWRILHPTSLSSASRAIVRFALSLTEAYGADLTLLHVLDESVMGGSYVKEVFAAKNGQMNELIGNREEMTSVHTIVEAGEPVLEILRIADAIEADWLVMGIEHDHEWWSMTNNAAYQVIARSHIPVLVVRDRMLDSAAEWSESINR